LQNNLNRWYDSSTGRWISQNPIGFAAGDANLYRYVGNGPTNATDPSGLKESKGKPISPTDLRVMLDLFPRLPGENLKDYLANYDLDLVLNVPATRIGPVGVTQGTGVCLGLGYQKGSWLFNPFVRSIHGFLTIDDKGYGAFERNLNSFGTMEIRDDELRTYPSFPPSPSKVVPPFYSVLGELRLDPKEHDVDKFRTAIQAYVDSEMKNTGKSTYIAGLFDCFSWTEHGIRQALRASRIQKLGPEDETDTERVILSDPWPVDPIFDIFD
jgi:hypothetical protein